MYSVLKQLHMACAILSISGFVLRGIWAIFDSPLLQKKWVKVLPHVIDTIFLIAGLWLAALIQQYPGSHNWLTAKVVGLLVYIVLGVMTLRLRQSKPLQVSAFVLAVTTFLYIYGVALHHNAASWLTP